VVHFDRLKLFKGDVLGMQTRDSESANSQTKVDSNPQQASHQVGEELELWEDDDDLQEWMPATSESNRRYPSHPHQPPVRFHDFVATLTLRQALSRGGIV